MTLLADLRAGRLAPVAPVDAAGTSRVGPLPEARSEIGSPAGGREADKRPNSPAGAAAPPPLHASVELSKAEAADG